jgi:hypothetical protein
MATPRNNFSKATANNFQLIFPKIPTGDSIKDMQSLTLNIHQTVIPSISLTQTEIPWQGGKMRMELGSLEFENWNVGFTIDSAFQNWKSLYKWLTYINNGKDNYGQTMDKYKVDATLQILNNFRTEIMVVEFKGVWINSLGEVTLTYREGTANLDSNAVLSYDRYEIRGI